MKKHLLLMLVVASITFSFLSCSSDDDDAPLTSLKGTEWVNNEEKDLTMMLNFTTEKDFYFTKRDKNGQTVEKGTYTFEPPIVHFTVMDEKTKKTEKLTGRVDGKSLTVKEVVYKRK
jgi:hypothetical protein